MKIREIYFDPRGEIEITTEKYWYNIDNCGLRYVADYDTEEVLWNSDVNTSENDRFTGEIKEEVREEYNIIKEILGTIEYLTERKTKE